MSSPVRCLVVIHVSTTPIMSMQTKSSDYYSTNVPSLSLIGLTLYAYVQMGLVAVDLPVGIPVYRQYRHGAWPNWQKVCSFKI